MVTLLQEIKAFQGEIEAYQRREAVLGYQIQHLNQLEKGYRNQIDLLKKRLSDFTEGRAFESEILNEKVVQARTALWVRTVLSV